MTIITDILTLAKKDILLEFRKKETLFSMGIFSFASVLIFSTLNELVGISLNAKNTISAAYLWFIVVFMTMLGITSIFSREIKKSSIYSLQSLPIKPQAIFLGKLFYLTVILAIVEIITLIFAIIFLRIDFKGDFLLFCLILTIGTVDLATAGCVVSFLTIYARSKTLAVPILFIPLILPSTLIATQSTTDLVFYNDPVSVVENALLLLIHSVLIVVFALLIVEELISE
ncbi:MAG: heme exporter protein CcmB [Promethearchaeota archaeon]